MRRDDDVAMYPAAKKSAEKKTTFVISAISQSSALEQVRWWRRAAARNRHRSNMRESVRKSPSIDSEVLIPDMDILPCPPLHCVQHLDPANMPAAFEIGCQPDADDFQGQILRNKPFAKGKHVRVVVLP